MYTINDDVINEIIIKNSRFISIIHKIYDIKEIDTYINKIKEYHFKTRNLFELIKNNQIENEKLKQLRDTLLPKLMSGEIDVNRVEV